MALTGTYNHVTYKSHPTNVVEYTVSYPSDLNSDHPFYEDRGTTQTVTKPEVVEEITTFENCYIIVRASNVQVLDSTPKVIAHEGFWRIYASQEERESNPESFLEEFHFSLDWDWEIQTNPFIEAYTYIKSLPGTETLTDI